MSLWWMWGGGTTANTGTPATNVPSLWSSGVRWGDVAAAFGDGTDAYWAAPSAPTGRSGKPVLCIAIGGELVTNQLMSASWSLGRQDWLSTLTATNASFEFVDRPIAHVNDTIVVSLQSDTTEYHNDALWVGRVTSVRSSRQLGGFITSSVSATDVVGVLGQAEMPTSILAGHTLQTLTEQLAEDAGVALQVDTDPLVTLPTLDAASDLSGKVLDLVNRAERSSNALLFLRGNGRLYAAMRDSTNASSAKVVSLDGVNAPAGWTEDTSLQNVVTRWELGNPDTPWSTSTEATTLEEYGEHAYSATDLLINDPAPYANLIASDVMSAPRALLVDAPFPITDLGQAVLYLNPLDRVVNDGQTWQVMSVQHNVSPGEWSMNITADATQEALVGADEPGPVTPPALNTVTLEYTSSKSACVNESGDDNGGLLFVGKFTDDPDPFRAYIEFDIEWPENTIRVVSATLHLTVDFKTADSRMEVRRVTESWTETGLVWSGPHATTSGKRVTDVTKTNFSIGVSAIAAGWLASGDNYGLHLRSTNEDNPARRVSFWSDDDPDPDLRPRLTLIVEVVS